MQNNVKSHEGINLFYLLLAIISGLVALFAFVVWTPREQPKPVSIVPAPTVIVLKEDIPTVIEATSTATSTLPIAQSASALLALMKPEVTTSPAKKSVTPGAAVIAKSKLPTDRISPTTPNNLVLRSVSYNQAIISWSPSTDNRGVAGYAIYQDSVLIGTTIKTIQGFIRLLPMTKHTFGVASYDSAGNQSNISTILVTTTMKPVAVAVSAEIAPVTAPLTPVAPVTPLPPPTPTTPNLCGNGVQDRGEECDDGTQNGTGHRCKSDCTVNYCRDGYLDVEVEQCDDGNEYDNDYCDNQCQNHVPIGPGKTPAPAPSPAGSGVPIPGVSVTANPGSVTNGGSSVISWTSTDATSCSSASGGGTGTTGSFTKTGLTSNTTFTVTCTGAGGSGSGSVTVAVGAAGSPAPPPPPPAPTVAVTANPSSIAYGATSNISWTSTNASSCSSASGGGTGVTGSFTTPALTSSRSYTVNCTGAGGSGSGSASVTVAAAPVGATIYTVNVTSAGNYSPTSLTLKAGDSIKFVYTPPISGEVVTRFTPTTVSSVTIDSEFTNKTRAFPSAGTWTFKAQDHNGNTGTVVVQ